MIFAVPLSGASYLVYAPLQGVAFVANPALLRHLAEGDPELRAALVPAWGVTLPFALIALQNGS